jgi:hypothetical protein
MFSNGQLRPVSDGPQNHLVVAGDGYTRRAAFSGNARHIAEDAAAVIVIERFQYSGPLHPLELFDGAQLYQALEV